MKESIKKGFGLTVGSFLAYIVIEATCATLNKLTDKKCPKTEKEPESGDSQE